MIDKNYLTTEQAAEYLNIPLSTFRKKVSERWNNIPLLKFGKRILFQRQLLDRWMENLMLKESNFKVKKVRLEG